MANFTLSFYLITLPGSLLLVLGAVWWVSRS